MFFIGLLVAATSAIALAAAYFSVYGLAYTFSGVFWSVVAMGASLEAGKLVAASYLYRYWDKTHRALKYYLMAGVACLMVLTSTGIFGYLSTGYQQDILPLQQKNEQIKLIEADKAQTQERKKQIDALLTGGAQVTNVNRANGTIDPNAARALRETTKARESLSKQYRDEQVQVTKHSAELDAQLLVLKQEVLKTEAHIGPITYIAKAFGLPSDDATKYLIFIIIFAFDPMAVALTLATNNALEIRRKEKAAAVEEAKIVEPDDGAEWQPYVAPEPGPEDFIEVTEEPMIVEDFIFPSEEHHKGRGSKVEVLPGGDELEFPVIDATAPVPVEPDPIPESVVERELIDQPLPEPDPEPEVIHEEEDEPPEELMAAPEPEPTPTPLVEEADRIVQQPSISTGRKMRPFSARREDLDISGGKLRELINHHKYLKAKQDSGDTLSSEEGWELNAIEDVLRRQGVDMYL